MATAQPKYDPSMEELLASIRRIISEDDQPAAHVQPDTPDYGFSDAFDQEMAPQDDFAGLDPAMLPDLIEQSIREAFPTADAYASGHAVGGWGAPDMEAFSAALVEEELGYDEAGHDDPSPAEAGDDWGDPYRVQDDDPHNFEPLSRPVGRARAAADEGEPYATAQRFAPDAEEIRRLLSDRSEETVGSSFDALARSVDAPSSRGLEEVVQDCLRPMLRAWLDENLPPIVERMVQQEIARVTRRR
jgi:cell pole-organizing protein PopZ